jgi:hypothetical protein
MNLNIGETHALSIRSSGYTPSAELLITLKTARADLVSCKSRQVELRSELRAAHQTATDADPVWGISATVTARFRPICETADCAERAAFSRCVELKAQVAFAMEHESGQAHRWGEWPESDIYGHGCGTVFGIKNLETNAFTII